MAIQLNEPIIVELVERLDSDLAGTITAINAGVTDGYTIDPPAEVYDYIPPPGVLTAFPSVGIGDAPSTFEDDIGSSATGRHGILIVAYQQADEQRKLVWSLRRYAQAITRVVLQGRKLDSAAWGTGLVAVRPGPTLEDDPESPSVWTSWVGVEIWAKRDEE
jgi:hypothetical protein